MIRRGTKLSATSNHVEAEDDTRPTTKSATLPQISPSTPPITANNRFRKLEKGYGLRSKMSDSEESMASANSPPTTPTSSTASSSDESYSSPIDPVGAPTATNTCNVRLVDDSLPADIQTNPPVFSTLLAYTNVRKPRRETLYTPARLLQTIINYNIQLTPPYAVEVPNDVPEPTNPTYYEETQARRLAPNRGFGPTGRDRLLEFIEEKYNPSNGVQFLDLPKPIMTKIFGYVLIYPHSMWPWQYAPRPEVRAISGPPPQVDLFEAFRVRHSKPVRRAFDIAKNVFYRNNTFVYATSNHKRDFEEAIGWVNCLRVNGQEIFDPGFGPEDEEVVWAGPVTDEDMGEEGWEEVGKGEGKGPQEITEETHDEEAAEPVEDTANNLLEENPLHRIEVPPSQQTMDAWIMSFRGVVELMDEHEVMDGCSETFAQEYIDLVTDNWI